MNWLVIDKIIKSAIIEDIPTEDITTDNTIDVNSRSLAELIVKENGIISGLEVFKRTYLLLGDVETEFFVKDGDEVRAGEIIGKVRGNTRVILSGERTALNFLQRMSGVATLTYKFVEQLEGTNTKLLDTRKTTPNLRVLEKYAVKTGGGHNHRLNLSDGVMLKDNHISAAGGIKKAVDIIKVNVSPYKKIEVEIENIDDIQEAIEAGVDIIMLDNMSVEMMTKAVSIIDRRTMVEASGNITLENIKNVANSGVDFISTGAITHSYKVLDLSLKNLKNI